MGMDLVFADQGRRSVLSNHHPRVQTRIRGQERWQTRQVWIDHLLDAALAHIGQGATREAQIIQDHRQGLTMEEPRAEDLTCHRIYNRIVRHSSQFIPQDIHHMLQCGLEGPMNLGHAAQAIGILHAITLIMTLDHLAAPQHASHIGSRAGLPITTLEFRQPLAKRLRRSHQSLQADGRNDVRHPGQVHGPDHLANRQRLHHFGSVDQGQPFLGLQDQGFKTRLLQGRSRPHALALQIGMPMPHPGGSHVGERR